MAKLRLDEFAFYLLNDFQKASVKAECLIAIFEEQPNLAVSNPIAYSNELMNLAAYYSALNFREKAISILNRFKSKHESEKGVAKHYIENYIFTNFQVAIDNNDLGIAKAGLPIWEKNKEFLLSKPLTSRIKITLLLVCGYYISIADYEKARSNFQVLYQSKFDSQSPRFLAMFMIIHLIVLLEENDSRGLESFGRNYKRKFKKLLPSSLPALETLNLIKLFGEKDQKSISKKTIEIEIEKLKEFSSHSEYQNALWYSIILNWLKRKVLD